MLEEQISMIDTELAEIKAKCGDLEAKRNQFADELTKARKAEHYNSIVQAIREPSEWTRQCEAKIDLEITYRHNGDNRQVRTFGCSLYINGPADVLPPLSAPASDCLAGFVRFDKMTYVRHSVTCTLQSYSLQSIIDFLNRSNFKKVEIAPKLDDIVELFLAVLHSTNIEGES